MKLITWPYYSAEYLKSQGLSPTFPQRFWEKVLVTDTCWLWIGGTSWGNKRNGVAISKYGCIGARWEPQLKRANMIGAHVGSWLITRGPIPPETPCVLHDCPIQDNPLCVNPAHLYLGTKADNARDALVKGQSVQLHGEAHGSSKLTEQAVLEIRASKEHVKVLAARYGVTHGHIFVIRGKRGWRWLETPGHPND